MSLLIFDPFSGISGDMTLAALIDLGLDADWLRGFVRDLGIGDVTVHVDKVSRRGISAPHVRFEYPPEHAHRHLRHVVEIIDRCAAPETARERAKEAFRLIAAAEAKVHGTTIEKVHFHEVGALDAILDIVSIMAAVEHLGFSSFATRPVAVGSGWIDIQHGRYPVPAPATFDLLHGLPLTGTDLAGECTTPTGAAVLAVLTVGTPAPASFSVVRTGFGAGTRDSTDRPNVLRLIAAESAANPAAELWVLQADIDDLAPEYVAGAVSELLEAGALDATTQPVGMKKGRPGTRLEVLAPAARRDELERILFQGTTTIGLRRWAVERSVLERTAGETEWRGQRIRWKHVRLPDGTSRAKPEYDDIASAARALGLTPYDVRAALGGVGGEDSGDGPERKQ